MSSEVSYSRDASSVSDHRDLDSHEEHPLDERKDDKEASILTSRVGCGNPSDAFQTAEIYTPLSLEESQFRVLILSPSEDKGSPLRCNLKIHDGDHLPPYEALSYTWGRDVASEPLYMGEQAVAVSSNLHDALRALRLLKKDRSLWVDAWCINQSDNEEKAVQVTLMGTIYSRAKCVLVWLGPSTSESRLAMSTLRDLRKVEDLENLPSEGNAAIGDLFNRPWFTRVWTIQEWALGKENVFICGADAVDSVSWKGVEEVLKRVLRPETGSRRESKRAQSELLERLERRDIWAGLLMDRGDLLIPGMGGYLSMKSFHTLVEQHIGLDST